MDVKATMQRVDANARRPSRRQLLGWLGGTGAMLAAVACTPAPTSSPAAPPASQPTTAPATAPTTAPAKPAAPAAQATAAPAKRTFTPVEVTLAGSTSPRTDTARRVGIKQGFFSEFGVTLNHLTLSGTANTLRAVVNNESTFGESNVLTTVAAIESGTPVKLIGTFEGTLGHILFVRPEIKSIKDLEGKIVGNSQPGSLIDNITRLMLRQGGVDPENVEFVSVGGSSDIYKALIVGKVDAGAATDAFLATASRDGVVPLVKSWEALPNYVSSNFIATEQGVTERRDLIVRTLAGFAKTFRFLNDPASKDVWVEVAVSELQQEPEQAEIAWQGIFEAKTYRPDLAIRRDQIEYMQQLNLELGSQKAMLPFEQIADTSLLREALALVDG